MRQRVFITDAETLLRKRKRSATKQELDRLELGIGEASGPGGALATEGAWIVNEGDATGSGWSLTFDDNGEDG